MMEHASKPRPFQGPARAGPPPFVDSAALFGERKELAIRHAGETYRLRITKNGKLILTK